MYFFVAISVKVMPDAARHTTLKACANMPSNALKHFNSQVLVGYGSIKPVV